MKKLFKIWFINPLIEDKIRELEEKQIPLVMSRDPKAGQQEKANLFCEIKKYDFALKTLKSML